MRILLRLAGERERIVLGCFPLLGVGLSPVFSGVCVALAHLRGQTRGYLVLELLVVEGAVEAGLEGDSEIAVDDADVSEPEAQLETSLYGIPSLTYGTS